MWQRKITVSVKLSDINMLPGWFSSCHHNKNLVSSAGGHIIDFSFHCQNLGLEYKLINSISAQTWLALNAAIQHKLQLVTLHIYRHASIRYKTIFVALLCCFLSTT